MPRLYALGSLRENDRPVHSTSPPRPLSKRSFSAVTQSANLRQDVQLMWHSASSCSRPRTRTGPVERLRLDVTRGSLPGTFDVTFRFKSHFSFSSSHVSLIVDSLLRMTASMISGLSRELDKSRASFADVL